MNDAVVWTLALGIPVLTIIAARAVYRWQHAPTPVCDHCVHWMHTTDSGLVTYQHCCLCGRVIATHVVDLHADQPWSYSAHGRYLAYTGRPNHQRRHTA